MTATTNEVTVRVDGEEQPHRGVVYVDEGVDPATGEEGIALQYTRSQDGPDVEFIPGGELVGVYDEVSEDTAHDRFEELVRAKRSPDQ